MDNHLIKNDLYYMEHPAEFEAMSGDEGAMSKFLAGEYEPVTVDTDEAATKAAAEEAAKKKVADDAAAAAAKTDKAPATDDDPEKVIQAKDGKNVIPYSELEKSREETKKANEEVIRLEGIVTDNAEAISTLKANMEAAKLLDEGGGGSSTDEQDKVLEDFKKDYSEISEAVELLIGTQVGAKLDTIETALQGLKEQNEKTVAANDATEANLNHAQAILDAHPDFQSIIDDGKLSDWIEKQPSLVREGLTKITSDGDTSQIIQLFQDFKDANPDHAKTEAEKDVVLSPEEQKVKDEEAKKIAAKKIKDAEVETPASLSDIAGGAVHHDESEAMQAMNGQALLGKFEGKSHEQIFALMDKVL